MPYPAYAPVSGHLAGFDFVVFEPARAQKENPLQAARLLSLSRLCAVVADMKALAGSGLGFQSYKLPNEIALAAKDMGFRLTATEGLERAYQELRGFLSWQSADYMAKASGFHPMDRFFAVATGQVHVNFVYGIGGAQACGDQLCLVSTRERACVGPDLVECRDTKLPSIFSGHRQDKLWLIPEMDFPGPSDYLQLSDWARETLSARS